MTARTHDAFAFASLITIAAYYPPSALNLYTFSASIIGNIVGSLIPDMDDAGNRLWDLLPGGNFAGRIFRRVFYKHRTITHSFVGVYLLYKILEWGLPKLLNPNFVDIKIILASIMIGYISHLLADSLTKEGLPLLFPINLNFGIPPISALRIRTGGFLENFMVLPSVALYIFWFIAAHKDKLLGILKLIQS